MDLRCYYCYPLAQENCTDPIQDNIPIVNCEEFSEETITFCYSVYLEGNTLHIFFLIYTSPNILNFLVHPPNESDSGIYRGCWNKFEDNLTICDYLTKKMGSSSNVTWCSACTQDYCNEDIYQTA
jgi:hypothetical protein